MEFILWAVPEQSTHKIVSHHSVSRIPGIRHNIKSRRKNAFVFPPTRLFNYFISMEPIWKICLSKPGINIIHSKDGSAKKVFIKSVHLRMYLPVLYPLFC